MGGVAEGWQKGEKGTNAHRTPTLPLYEGMYPTTFFPVGWERKSSSISSEG